MNKKIIKQDEIDWEPVKRDIEREIYKQCEKEDREEIEKQYNNVMHTDLAGPSMEASKG